MRDVRAERVTEGWKQNLVGQSVFAAGTGKASPRSFRSQLFASGNRSARRAQLIQTFTNVTSLHCSFWFRILERNNDTDFLHITYEKGATSDSVWLDITATDTVIQPAQRGVRNIDANWTFVSFDLNERFSVYYDNSLIEPVEDLNGAPIFGKVVMQIGLFTDQNDPATAEYDDVVCTKR